jgi:putative hemolysin
MIWFFIAICLLFSFVLSGLESAMLTVSMVRVRHRAEEKDTNRARKLLALFRQRDRVLASLLLVNDIITLLAFALVTRELVHHFGNSGYLIAFLVSLPVYLFAFELIPKSLFRNFPYRALHAFFPLLSATDLTIGNLLRLTSFFPTLVADSGNEDSAEKERKPLLGSTDREEPEDVKVENPAVSGREAFRNLAGIIERDGTLGRAESQLIRNVLDFPKVPIYEVMVPLTQVTAIPLNTPIVTALAIARDANVNQLPVLSSDGKIIGLVNVLEILRTDETIGSSVNFMRRIVRAHPNDLAAEVLKELRKTGVQLAAIIDPETKEPLGVASTQEIIQRMIHGHA